MQTPNPQMKSYVLTLTGPSATRERLLPAIESHLSPRPRNDPNARPLGVCKPTTDFGGLYNPLAEVHMTTTQEGVDQSVEWMKSYAARHHLLLNISVQEHQPEPRQAHEDESNSV